MQMTANPNPNSFILNRLISIRVRIRRRAFTPRMKVELYQVFSPWMKVELTRYNNKLCKKEGEAMPTKTWQVIYNNNNVYIYMYTLN